MNKDSKQMINRKKIDPVYMRINLATTGCWRIPILSRCIVDISNIQLLGANHTNKNAKQNEISKTVHFFIDDNKLNKYFEKADVYIELLAQYANVLTPDFSLHANMPLPVQIYNIYRNRFCGAYWQLHNLSVIPTLSWSTKDSYSFCFEGIEKESVVAISTLGARKNKKIFLKGYDEMRKRIYPKQVLCFDEPFPEMGNEVVFAPYPKHQGEK